MFDLNLFVVVWVLRKITKFYVSVDFEKYMLFYMSCQISLKIAY